MTDSRDLMYAGREFDISLIHYVVLFDELTGQELSKERVVVEVPAVVTEISNKGGKSERGMSDGIVYESGDAKFDIRVSEFSGDISGITSVLYNNEEFEILGTERKGIGKINRFEIVGRVIT